MQRDKRSVRSRLTWGIILLTFGALALAVNLDMVPIGFWKYWPGVLLIMGLVQLAWPGSARARLSGYWLIAIGIYGFVTQFGLLGLHLGTSWPILVVALGIRIVLAGILRDGDAPPPNGTQNPPGASQ